jgi:RNA recognition motif-containing protein
MDIYVGNLPYEINEETLREVFSEFGSVEKVNVIMDRDTGRAKGFAFITMPDSEEAQNAIKSLDGNSVEGREMKVNQAKPREERPRRDRY